MWRALPAGRATSTDGTLRLAVPAFRADIAVRVMRAQPRPVRITP